MPPKKTSTRNISTPAQNAASDIKGRIFTPEDVSAAASILASVRRGPRRTRQRPPSTSPTTGMLCQMRSPPSTVRENRNEGRANYPRSPSSKTRPKSTIVCKNEKPFDPLDSRGKSSKNGANETDSTRSEGQDSNREIGTVTGTRSPRRSPAAKTCSYEGINDVRCGNDRGNDTRSEESGWR